MLHPIPDGVPVVGTPVGLVNPTRLKELGAVITARNVGSVLSYDGRQALIDGQPVEHDAIAEPLWEPSTPRRGGCSGRESGPATSRPSPA